MQNEELLNKLSNLDKLRSQLSEIKEGEMALRKEIAEEFFANPTEGTNTAEFNGLVVKLQHKFNHKVDQNALLRKIPDLIRAYGHDKVTRYLDHVFRVERTLNIKGYRELESQTDATSQGMLQAFQDCITSTPASPVLTISTKK